MKNQKIVVPDPLEDKNIKDNLDEIGNNFGKEWKVKFSELLENYSQHLSNDGVGEFPNCELEFKLKDYTPINSGCYNIPYRDWPVLYLLLMQYLEQGLIEPSKSQWNLPFFLMKKKSGKYQLVLDTRKLNKVTISEQC